MMVSSSEGKRRGRWLVATLAVVVVVLGATAGFMMVDSRDSSASAAVTLEPASSVGADPFTSSVTVGRVAEFPGNVRAVSTTLRQGLDTDQQTGTLVAVGTAPGLYGGSGDVHVCDPEKLVGFLNAHADKATAWARVFGITAKGIAGYVATLTPVVLTSDTLVTNHGYGNGVATSLHSVLQAGTAVMVDRTGTPRVKCNCGNPLAPPEAISLSSATLRGSRWAGYAPVQVTIVLPGTTVNTFTLTNITTGDPYSQPIGDSAIESGATGATGDLDGTYEMTLTDNSCGFGAEATHPQTLSLRGTGVTITDDFGVFRGTLQEQGGDFSLTATTHGHDLTVRMTGNRVGTVGILSGSGSIKGTIGEQGADCTFMLTGWPSSTSGAADTSTTDPGDASASGPPCTEAAVQGVLSSDEEFTGQPICEGPWAVITPTTSTGDDVTALLQANGRVWEIADRSIFCNPASVPAAIYQACFTN